MKIDVVYVLQAYDAHSAIPKRTSREELVAWIEEVLVKYKLVDRYTLTTHREFPFPFKRPNIMEMKSFFGDNDNYNAIAKEVEHLYSDPMVELKKADLLFQEEIEAATTSEQFCALIEKYHYALPASRRDYEEALVCLQQSWLPYAELKVRMEALGDSKLRGDIWRALAVLDNFACRSLMTELREVSALVENGSRDEAIDKLKSRYSSWSRDHVAHMYHAGGDVVFYGSSGFWLARLVPSACKQNRHGMTIENTLDRSKLPYQVVSI